MKTYTYNMSGTAADGQTWETYGNIDIETAAFPEVARIALKETFEKLTQGKAIFGLPGVGCSGPYDIKKFTVERLTPLTP